MAVDREALVDECRRLPSCELGDAPIEGVVVAEVVDLARKGERLRWVRTVLGHALTEVCDVERSDEVDVVAATDEAVRDAAGVRQGAAGLDAEPEVAR